MRSYVLALALLLPLAPGAAVGAGSCYTHLTNETPFLCRWAFSAASLGGSSSTIDGFEYLGLEAGNSDLESAGDGGLSGSARVETDWGAVHAFCTSDNGTFTVYDAIDAEARNVCSAEGAFADFATIVSPGGVLAPGTPVVITVTMSPDGGFSQRGAGGEVDLVIANNANFVGTRMERHALLSFDTTFVPPPFVFPNVAVGDTLIFSYHVRASAVTTNRVNPPVTEATADMESTARLFLDVGTPGAALEATSGHDYATVPEPSQALMLGVAAAALIWRGRPRRRT